MDVNKDLSIVMRHILSDIRVELGDEFASLLVPRQVRHPSLSALGVVAEVGSRGELSFLVNLVDAVGGGVKLRTKVGCEAEGDRHQAKGDM